MKQRIALTALGLAIIILYSSWGRPLWVDEFLHFAFGAFSNPQEAWAAVQSSTVGINHGQTGFYMMLDFILLKVAGANLFALRLPSLLSGALLLYATAAFLRTKNIGTLGIAASFLLLASQPNLMYYVGEARPYMPLAASIIGVLAYYSTPASARVRPTARILGWSSVIWGSLMMPYFLLYLPAVAITTYLLDCFTHRKRPTVHSASSFINLPLVIIGYVLGLGIGALTWLRGSPSFDRDPWLYVRPLFEGPNPWTITSLAIAACLVLLTVAFALVQGSNNSRRNLLPPLALMLMAGALATTLAVLSYVQNYWILPRQFVASQAIISVALIWLLATALTALSRGARTLLATLLLLSVAVAAARATAIQIGSLAAWSADGIPASESPPGSGNAFTEVAPANQNVLEGGTVWPEFALIYDRPRIQPNEIP